MNWNNKKEVQKGNFGEQIADKYWEIAAGQILGSNAVAYSPHFDEPHPVDRIWMDLNTCKILACGEVKTKPRRNNYPDTGINITVFKRYSKIEVPVFLCFIDEIEGRCYGGWLTNLIKPWPSSHGIFDYPEYHNGIIYFPLEAMIDIAPLDQNEIKELQKMRTSNHDKLRIV